MAAATPLADIMELRLDLMESFDLDVMISAGVKPVLVTYRSEEEGGKGTNNPEIASDYLVSAAQKGAHMIDVEFKMPLEYRQRILDVRGKSGVIISAHINDRTPSRKELKRLLDDIIRAGGDVVKVVTMAHGWEDNFRVLELIPAARGMDLKIIAFCMGRIGRMSRIFSLLMGGHMVFTSLEKGQESAPGQISVGEMKMMLEYFAITHGSDLHS